MSLIFGGQTLKAFKYNGKNSVEFLQAQRVLIGNKKNLVCQERQINLSTSQVNNNLRGRVKREELSMLKWALPLRSFWGSQEFSPKVDHILMGIVRLYPLFRLFYSLFRLGLFHFLILVTYWI